MEFAEAKKGVVITGACGGIGAAAAAKLLSEGYEVFGIDIREPEVIDGMTYIKTDLTDPDAVDEAYRKVSNTDCEICGIVHTAGIYDLNSLVEISEEEMLRIFNVNLFAMIRVNRVFLPILSGDGRIVIVSSELAAVDPLPFTGIYAITKSAVEKYAYSLRMELQLLGYHVSVIRPGAVDTRILGISTERLRSFIENTKLYPVNATRFSKIVDKVESKAIKPEKTASIISKALRSKKPGFVYKVNRNPGLLLYNAVPDRLQTKLIGRILR